ncbi:MAG: hypothetical protein N2053_04110 [Chitinispirillaceae bacterium]|nr:hypothetical protein [Chitinispirillaceae bacterium]
MRTDAVIKKEGLKAIFEKLNIVEAERFITLIKREDFDYSEWRKDLWENESIEKVAIKAMEYYKKKHKGK